MSTLYQPNEYEEIKVSSIIAITDESNLYRGSETDPEIKELAANIKQIGLLQPITIKELPDSTEDKKLYKVTIGNRRLVAWKKAFPESETIKCFVLSKDTNIVRERMGSISENIFRLSIDPQDKGKVIKELLPLYDNNPSSLARALGYESADQINKWLDLVNVQPTIIKSLRGSEYLVTDRALIVSKLDPRIQKDVIEILNQRPFTDFKTKKFVNYVKTYPMKPVKEVLEMMESEPKSISVHAKFSQSVNLALIYASRNNGISKSEMVTLAVKEYLKSEGYLDTDGKAVKK
jgi:ParB/RepB/Spo0J family partition protein